MPEENIKQFIEEEGKKTRRHFDVVMKKILNEIQKTIDKITKTQTKKLQNKRGPTSLH